MSTFKKKILDLLPPKLTKCPVCEQHVTSMDNFMRALNPSARLPVKCKKCESILRINYYGIIEFFIIFFGYLVLTDFILNYVGFYDLFKDDEFYDFIYHVFTALYLFSSVYLAFYPSRTYGRRLFVPK